MDEVQYYLADDGRPFTCMGQAAVLRRNLAANGTTDKFQVVPHPDGGFAVARVKGSGSVSEDQSARQVGGIPEAPADALAREMALTAEGTEPPPIGGLLPPMEAPADRNAYKIERPEPVNDGGASVPVAEQGFAPRFSLRVAPRAFVRLHLLAAVGVALMISPHWLFAPLGGFSGFQNVALGASVFGLVRIGAVMLALVAIAKFFYAYLLYRFVVTEDYVEANLGWIARDAPKVFFAHIRTTSVVQSWWERLLMVGAVKIGTGATDQHEVVLRHIAHPKRIESELERRYLPFIRSQRRAVVAQ